MQLARFLPDSPSWAHLAWQPGNPLQLPPLRANSRDIPFAPALSAHPESQDTSVVVNTKPPPASLPT